MREAPVEIRLLESGDESVLDDVAPGVFDGQLDPELTSEFLSDTRHHLAVALDGTTVVGMASGVHYVHPDKRAQLFINEVGVAPAHQRAGIGRGLLETLLTLGRDIGCTEAWVATEAGNTVARGLYAAAGGAPEAEAAVVYVFALDESGPGNRAPSAGRGAVQATPEPETRRS